MMRLTKKIPWTFFFAVAMACVEAAVVVYLRRLYGITDVVDTPIPPFDPLIAGIEIGRELATLIMLFSFGWVAGQRAQSRLGFAFIAFGVWDIFYYVFLKIFLDWPHSLMETDLLFLIPLPWWGPVIAPMLVSLLMIAGGWRAILREEEHHTVHFCLSTTVSTIASILVMLYAFMEDALSALPAILTDIGQLKPSSFNWVLFSIGFFLAVLAVWRVTNKP